LYIVGGYGALGGGDPTVTAYNTLSNSWLSANPPSLLVGRHYHCATTAGGRIYVFGGNLADDSYTKDVESWAPGDSAWLTRTAMPENRRGCGAAVANGKIYVIGGGTGSDKSMLVYDYNANGWLAKTAAAPNAHDLEGLVPGSDGRLWAVGMTSD